jgi:hypothetical protein
VKKPRAAKIVTAKLYALALAPTAMIYKMLSRN